GYAVKLPDGYFGSSTMVLCSTDAVPCGGSERYVIRRDDYVTQKWQTDTAVRPRFTGADWAGLGVLVLFLGIGLTWSKWLPYWDRAWTLQETAAWVGDSLFDSLGETFSLAGAENFTLVYFDAVWIALLV